MRRQFSVAFGKGDRLAIMKRTTSTGNGSGMVTYTKPARHGWYSEFGFTWALDSEETPLHLVLGNKLPLTNPDIKKADQESSYLLVDHNGQLWYVFLNTNDGKTDYSLVYIDKDDPDGGWWTTYARATASVEQDILTGILYTDPTDELLSEYFFTNYQGSQIHWLSIKDIVDKLNKDHPKVVHKEVEVSKDLYTQIFGNNEAE